MNEKINALIDSYRDEFIRTLQAWIRVPSVKGEPAEGAPFGGNRPDDEAGHGNRRGHGLSGPGF